MPYLCLIGCSRRRDLSVLPLSHQLEIGAKRCIAGAGAAAPVGDAVGAGRVPGHADHLRAVIAVVGRPPRHRRGQELLDVAASARRGRSSGRRRRSRSRRRADRPPSPFWCSSSTRQPVRIPVLQGRTAAEGPADAVASERALARHRVGIGVGLVDRRRVHQHPPWRRTGGAGRAALATCHASTILHRERHQAPASKIKVPPPAHARRPRMRLGTKRLTFARADRGQFKRPPGFGRSRRAADRRPRRPGRRPAWRSPGNRHGAGRVR